MPFTNEINQAALDHMFGKATWTAPTTIDVGLSTTAPALDGTNITEPAGGSYARVATAVADWTRTGNDMENNAQVDFPEATASWGTVTHFVLYDNADNSVVGYGTLTASQAVGSGQQPYFPIGSLVARYTSA